MNDTGGSATDKTLLDEFAGQALPELVRVTVDSESYYPKDAANDAYAYAQAMVAEKRRIEGAE